MSEVEFSVHMSKWAKDNEMAKRYKKDIKVAIIASLLALLASVSSISFFAGVMICQPKNTHEIAYVVEPTATPIPTPTPTPTPTPEPTPTPTPEPTPEPEPTEYLPEGFKYLDIPLSKELQLHAAMLCEQTDCMWYSLMLGIMNIETGGTFSNNLESSMGALGIMQVMPDNIRAFCAETGYTYDEVVNNPKVNMMAGIWVWELGVHNYSRTNTAGYLMRYNAGPGNAAPMIEAGVVSSYASTVLSYEAMYTQMLQN